MKIALCSCVPSLLADSSLWLLESMVEMGQKLLGCKRKNRTQAHITIYHIPSPHILGQNKSKELKHVPNIGRPMTLLRATSASEAVTSFDDRSAAGASWSLLYSNVLQEAQLGTA